MIAMADIDLGAIARQVFEDKKKGVREHAIKSKLKAQGLEEEQIAYVLEEAVELARREEIVNRIKRLRTKMAAPKGQPFEMRPEEEEKETLKELVAEEVKEKPPAEKPIEEKPTEEKVEEKEEAVEEAKPEGKVEEERPVEKPEEALPKPEPERKPELKPEKALEAPEEKPKMKMPEFHLPKMPKVEIPDFLKKAKEAKPAEEKAVPAAKPAVEEKPAEAAPPAPPKPKEEIPPAITQAVGLIREAIGKGYSVDECLSTLIDAGYSNGQITEIMNLVLKKK